MKNLKHNRYTPKEFAAAKGISYAQANKILLQLKKECKITRMQINIPMKTSFTNPDNNNPRVQSSVNLKGWMYIIPDEVLTKLGLPVPETLLQNN